jgi:glycosyltransferase involved in cell wall biosynthesis
VPHADVERYYSLVDIAPFPRLPIPVCEMVSPLKPFEAMAMKKVCIVSSVAAMAEIVQHGVTGLVFDKHSVDSLIDTLNRAIDDAELRQTIGENARTWVLAERTWEQAADRVNAIYSKLTNK